MKASKRCMVFCLVLVMLFYAGFFHGHKGMASITPGLQEPYYYFEKEGRQVRFHVIMDAPEEIVGDGSEYQLKLKGFQGLAVIRRVDPVEWEIRWIPYIDGEDEIKVEFLLNHEKTGECVACRMIAFPCEREEGCSEGDYGYRRASSRSTPVRGYGSEHGCDGGDPLSRGNTGTEAYQRYTYGSGVPFITRTNFPYLTGTNGSFNYKDLYDSILNRLGESSGYFYPYSYSYWPSSVSTSRNKRYNPQLKIAVDSKGTIYVVNNYGNSVIKADSDGRITGLWEVEDDDGNEYYHLKDIAVDNDDFVYLLDSSTNQVLKYKTDGEFITSWDTSAGEGDILYNPEAIATDNDNRVYILYPYKGRIQKYTQDGEFISGWKIRTAEGDPFYYPDVMAIDNSNFVYLANSYDNEISKFTSEGEFITKWQTSKDSEEKIFNRINAIATGDSGLVYVADSYNCRVLIFSSEGELISEFKTRMDEDAITYRPDDIAVDDDGIVYIVDSYKAEVLTHQPVEKAAD